MNSLVLGILLAVLAACSARNLRQLQRSNFLGDGSNDVAVTLLQRMAGEKKNTVFSPLGYNTLLAVLTEGARGNTRNQLVSALKLSEDTYAVRSTFKRVLSQMTEKDVLNKPEFKNWFYVYKNFTVEESFKQNLKDNYLIDVKEVDRYDWDDKKTDKPEELEGGTQSQSVHNNQIDGVTEKEDSSEEDVSKESDEQKEKESDEKKDKESDEEKKKESAEKNSKEDDSKEDSSGESKEKPTKTKKPSNIMKISEKDSQKKPDPLAGNDGEQNPDMSSGTETLAEATTSKQDATTKDESEYTITPEMTTLEPEGTTGKTEPMQSETERQPENSSPSSDKPVEVTKSEIIEMDVRTGMKKRDTVNALSVNKLSDIDSVRESTLRKSSRMLVFNALYFRGNWSVPFGVSPEKRPFRVSPSEEVMVEMIHAENEFEAGRVAELGAWALDLPYQGDRYSLLILVPDGDGGVEGLVKKLPGFSFYKIDKELTKLPMRVCIPKLKYFTITKPKEDFIKSGITDLFNEDADLSGMSGTKGLFLEDLVQLVAFEVDENASSYNYLTSTQVSELRGTLIPFTADQPFVFFLRDKVEDLNVVSGIVNNPLAPQDP